MVMKMKLKTLLKKANINTKTIINNHMVNDLKDDSTTVMENDIFFAIKGGQTDGKHYVNDVILKGAKTIIYEGEIVKEYHHINYIKVINIKRTLALFCKIYYNDLTKKIKVIGITGTNGKTTISTLIFDYLAYSGIDSLLIGTNGVYFKDEHYHTSNTTINILTTYSILKESIKKGCKYLIMEVSSIGIREARVMYFDFDIIVFTNLTHDHLDYHKNMTDYKFSKAHLIWDMDYKKDKVVILNKDDDTFDFFSSLSKTNVLSYGIKEEADYQAQDINKNIYKTNFKIIIRNNTYQVKSSLIGGFNIYNLLSVFAVVDFLGFDLLSLVDFLKLYVLVSGRMNRIYYRNRTIIVDFAHTPNSVLNVLSSIKEFTNHKITVIIGCGGNRDVAKRSVIAKIATDFADKVIFTSDNPRDENPLDIIKDMTIDLKKDNYKSFVDREEAINYALDNSVHDEVIAILGKGSEREQIVNGIKYPFSDKEVVYSWISKNSEKNIKI